MNNNREYLYSNDYLIPDAGGEDDLLAFEADPFAVLTLLTVLLPLATLATLLGAEEAP